MLWRVRNSRGRPLNAPAAFILPCQPIVARQPPSGETGVKIAEKHPPSKKDIRLSISVHSYPLGGWREPLSSIRWRRLLRCGSGGDNWDKLSLSLETDRRYFISGISFQHHRPKYCLQPSVTERPIALPPVPVRECAMPKAIILDPSPPIGQRRCPLCGVPMFLSQIEPADQDGYDERTFECSQCAYAETVIVQFR